MHPPTLFFLEPPLALASSFQSLVLDAQLRCWLTMTIMFFFVLASPDSLLAGCPLVLHEDEEWQLVILIISSSRTRNITPSIAMPCRRCSQRSGYPRDQDLVQSHSPSCSSPLLLLGRGSGQPRSKQTTVFFFPRVSGMGVPISLVMLLYCY